MTPTRILLDCDPGIDDALALVLAHGDPAVELVAVTTVGGNVGLESTTRNALELRDYLGFSGVPVAAGAARPLVRQPGDARHVHGESGLGGVSLPAATGSVTEADAVDLIIDTIRASPGSVHLVATGPMTNIATALQRDPEIAHLVASFVIMGGAYTRGNATPAAEFNIFADPEAAAIVFAAGWTVVMVGLDLTMQAIATPDVVERMSRLGRLGAELLVPLSTFWLEPEAAHPAAVQSEGQAVHDVCAVAYVTRPDLFESRTARVDVETAGEFTSGMTVVDFDSRQPNAIVPIRIDVDGFWEYALGCWAAAGSSSAGRDEGRSDA